MWFALIRRILTAALLSGVLHIQASAHEGHDHGAAVPRPSVPAAPRAEASSDAFEVVAIARGGEIILYVDRFATNEPVLGASISVELPQSSVEAKEAPEGAYRIEAPWASAAGRYDLIITITYKDESDILPITLEIPAPSSPGGTSGNIGLISPAVAQGLKEQLRSNPMSIAAVVLVILAVALVAFLVGRRRGAALLVVIATGPALVSNVPAHEGEGHSSPRAGAASATLRDVAQVLPEGGVFVPKPTQRILAIRTVLAEAASYRRTVELPGRVIPDPNASGYVQTAISGRLSPPEGGFPRLGTRVKKGDVLAYVTPPLQAIDVSDMRQKQGELDQQIAIVERRVVRFEKLATTGAVAKVQLDEARLELEGLRDRRAALDKARREPEALVAPVDGVIAEGSPIAGQIAQTNAIVFHIIDPSRLWIEALSYEAPGDLERATARVGTQMLSLAFRGAGFTDRNQSIPIHFAIETGGSAVRVGQFVTVFAETQDEQNGLAVPRASIVRTTAGQEVVYEHVAAERFEPRPVRTEPLDGGRVLISHGLAPGRRVVTQGAELLEHIR